MFSFNILAIFGGALLIVIIAAYFKFNSLKKDLAKSQHEANFQNQRAENSEANNLQLEKRNQDVQTAKEIQSNNATSTDSALDDGLQEWYRPDSTNSHK